MSISMGGVTAAVAMALKSYQVSKDFHQFKRALSQESSVSMQMLKDKAMYRLTDKEWTCVIRSVDKNITPYSVQQQEVCAEAMYKLFKQMFHI